MEKTNGKFIQDQFLCKIKDLVKIRWGICFYLLSIILTRHIKQVFMKL